MVCITVFIDSLGGSISAPVMPFYAREFNASSSTIGLLFSTYSLAQVIALPLLGRLSDHIGRRPVLVLSLFGAAAGAFLQGHLWYNSPRIAFKDADPFHRPKYGVLNVWNDPYGIYGCEQYGDSYLVLKDLRLRCTLAPQDSGGLPAQRLAVLDYYAHTLLDPALEELEETAARSNGIVEGWIQRNVKGFML
eukprot:g20826.t1